MLNKNNKPTVKPLPFFKKGTLVFKTSGHVLRLSDRHYRCDLDCRGTCTNKEPQIKKENIERTFSRYVKKFAIEPAKGEQLFKKLLKDNFFDILFAVDENITGQDDVLDTTLDVMKQEVANGLKSSDKKDFATTYADKQKEEYPLVLFAYALAFIRACTHPEEEMEFGRTCALMTKRIFISDTGRIVEIEFERWGWYILNALLNTSTPNYLQEVQKKGVVILNQSDPLHTLSLTEASLYFTGDNFVYALRGNSKISYDSMKLMQLALKLLMQTDPDNQEANTLAFFDQLQNNPALQILNKAGILADLKIQKPKNQSNP